MQKVISIDLQLVIKKLQIGDKSINLKKNVVLNSI